MNNEIKTEEYNKHTAKIHTHLHFTQFDRDYLRSLGNRIMRLEEQRDKLINAVGELQRREHDLKREVEQLNSKVMINVR